MLDRGRLSASGSHSAARLSVLSISAFLHSSPRRRPAVFMFSFLSQRRKKAMHDSFKFFPLCVLFSPLIYCWTCSPNDPEAFHSVKEGKKDSELQWVDKKTHIRNRKEMLSNLHSEKWHMSHNCYLYDTLFVMNGAAQWVAARHKRLTKSLRV